MTWTARTMLLVCLLCLLGLSTGLKHEFFVKGDSRKFIGPIGIPFGFLDSGVYNLTVFDFRVEGGNEIEELDVGFYLKRFESEASFHQFAAELDSDHCSFDIYLSEKDDDNLFGDADDDYSAFITSGDSEKAIDGIFLSMANRDNWGKHKKQSIEYKFEAGEEGLYFLMYQICSDGHYESTFELDFHFSNRDRRGKVSYLTAGEMLLPLLFFFFAVVYSALTWIWLSHIWESMKQAHQGNAAAPAVYPIHHLMSMLLILKTLSVFFESIRYHYIRVSGHAELWSVLYYTFYFLKGSFLFTVILLIGSGWSFVKPFLTGRETKIILCVLILQVINNLAIVVLSQETEGEHSYDAWMAVLHMVDILCCCAVLIPIVWHVSALEKSVEIETEDGDVEITDLERDNEDEDEALLDETEKGSILSKLRRFRAFYILVVVYIYMTRIVVYLFGSMLDYRHIWVRFFAVELVTVIFYVLTGFSFRPMAEQQAYSSVKADEGVEMRPAPRAASKKAKD